jgi:hypothetical protein
MGSAVVILVYSDVDRATANTASRGATQPTVSLVYLVKKGTPNLHHYCV